jgi:L-fucose mutarotase
MQVVGRPDEIPPAVADFQTIIDGLAGFPITIARIERFSFYDRTRGCFAMVATGDRRLYANIILTKGVLDAEGKLVT